MLTSLLQDKRLMKTVNIHGKNLFIFCTTCGNSVKLSGKMWLMIKSHKRNQGFSLSLEDIFLGKPQGSQIDSPSLLRSKKVSF